ncbi:hypothetical protein SPRG_20365 [Saprolegnia parasitica CBS 223.65]|uniref:DH domain-containing protein n=1 Tax=Saprolegnia parasitica (strain CBS 223.65) TaxID=695850 RepID=A0A067CB75_SAPPC|nr:hypothetical protein SPRG_20365 [Saprolegnia parasitica CBS 223.65]KDO27713.1 hypothetical protein SPRG_20365 [Saprolegnia parasitica CBS 223.65]|eukprot:XP_012201599.1 hypothetical protein SPRG_20365 [Saprolegnia parasitica CBS 223.65]
MQSRVVDELVASEASYLTHLSPLIDALAVPLERAVPLEARRGNDVLTCLSAHGLLGQLRDLHVIFLDELRGVSAPVVDVASLGRLVALFAKVLRPVHTAYAGIYDDVTCALAGLRKHSAVAAVLAAFEASQKEPVANMLILPIQRLPRYVLLLRELEKQLSHQEIEAAKVAMEATASSVNISLQARANAQKIAKLQPLFPSLDLSQKTWLRDGKLSKTTINSRSGPREYLFHLFAEMLIYSDMATHGPLRVRRVLAIDDIEVALSPDERSIALVTPTKCMALAADTSVLTAAWWKHLSFAAAARDDEPVMLRGLLDAPKDVLDTVSAAVHVRRVWLQRDRAWRLGILAVCADTIVLAQTVSRDRHKLIAHAPARHLQRVEELPNGPPDAFSVTLDDKSQWVLVGKAQQLVDELRLAYAAKAKATKDGQGPPATATLMPDVLKELQSRLLSARPPPPSYAPPACPAQSYPPPIPTHRRKTSAVCV